MQIGLKYTEGAGWGFVLPEGVDRKSIKGTTEIGRRMITGDNTPTTGNWIAGALTYHNPGYTFVVQ